MEHFEICSYLKQYLMYLNGPNTSMRLNGDVL